MTNWKYLIEEHYENLANEISELEFSDPKVRTELYLYPDGSTMRFENPSGNSRMNDDHAVIYQCDHSVLDAEWYDEDGSLMVSEWDVWDAAEEHLNALIASLEQEEQYKGVINREPDSTIPEIFARTLNNCRFYETNGNTEKLQKEVHCLRGIAYCMESIGRCPHSEEFTRLITRWG